MLCYLYEDILFYLARRAESSLSLKIASAWFFDFLSSITSFSSLHFFYFPAFI